LEVTLTRSGPLRLRFASVELEERFCADYDLRHRKLVAAGVVVGIGMHFLFLFLDRSVQPTLYRSFWFYRLTVALPILLVTLTLCLRAQWCKWVQPAAALAVAMSGVSLVLMLDVMEQADNPQVTYATGLLLVMFFAYSFLRLRLIYALFGCVSFTVFFEAMVLGRWDWGGPAALEQQFFIIGTHIAGIAACWTIENSVRQNFLSNLLLTEAHQATRHEREKSERLLLKILPPSIAERLREDHGVVADAFDNVAVLFIDLVGFTAMAESTPPAEVVTFLDTFFARLDRLTDKHGAEKIKTIGDAYMVIAGAPIPHPKPETVLANLALDLLEGLEQNPLPNSQLSQVRMGLHAGPVVAGVIGLNRFSYDLWGNTVNFASRLESGGIPGAIHISETIHDRLKTTYKTKSLGSRDIKGIGSVSTWLLVGKLPGE
jgi:class 3 adenylate cyclase